LKDERGKRERERSKQRRRREREKRKLKETINRRKKRHYTNKYRQASCGILSLSFWFI
jgi:hypothetical protein